MPSADAGFDASQLPLLRRRAGELLAGRGVFGLVWLNTDLEVQASFGTLVDFIAIGRPLSRSLPPLIGLEAEVKALQTGQTLRVPSARERNVPTTSAARLSLYPMRLMQRDSFQLGVARET